MMGMMLVAAVCGLAVAGPGVGQGGHGNGPGKGKGCERLEKVQQYMKDSLALTADQEVKIKTLHDSACARMKAAHASNKGDKQAMQEARKKNMMDVKEGYKTILTAEQLKKMQAHHKAQHAKGRKDTAGMADKMTAKMKKELSLTDDQTTKVKAANAEFVQRMKGLHEKKASGESKEQLQTLRKQIVNEHDAKIKAILTAEQATKWASLKEEQKKQMQQRHKQRRPKKD